MRRPKLIVLIVDVVLVMIALVAVSTSRLDAQILNFQRQVYTVKFLCGEFKAGDPQREGPVKPGNYQTAINVHNPNRLPVSFVKKAVLIYDQQRPPREFEQPMPPGQYRRAYLFPDWAMEIDCADIRLQLLANLASPPPVFLKGFVVIETFSTLSRPFPLDVVAAYTAHGFSTTDPSLPPVPEGFSLQVLPVSATTPASF